MSLWPWKQNPTFETVLEAQRRAKRFLPPSVYSALVSGSEGGSTPKENMQAFSQIQIAPRIADHKAQRDLTTSIMGVPVSLPVMIAPTGVQAVHPDGEVAVARAAAAKGIAAGLSSFASKPVEDVVAANPNTFFQMYWVGSREAIADRVERVRAAGVKGLIVTTDWSFSAGRDWGSPEVPQKLDFKTLVKMAPEGVIRPKWTAKWLAKGLPDLAAPNLKLPGAGNPGFYDSFGEWMQTPPPSWEDIEWLRELWGGKFMLKGITRVDDAKRAVQAGVDAISVSNHGGNNLDTTPATIRCLGAVVDAVGDDVEVLMDGGVRRGADVAKALALGARAVMIGRPSLWGLGANGQAGVENVIDIMRSGLDSTVLGLGYGSVHELNRGDYHIPAGFEVALGSK